MPEYRKQKVRIRSASGFAYDTILSDVEGNALPLIVNKISFELEKSNIARAIIEAIHVDVDSMAWANMTIWERAEWVNKELHAERQATAEKVNAVYAERDKLVALVVQMARKLGLRVGWRLHQHAGGDLYDSSKDTRYDSSKDTRLEPWDLERRYVIFADLPSGQVSWRVHDSEFQDYFADLPEYPDTWDGHSVEEKYRRVLYPELEKTNGPDR